MKTRIYIAFLFAISTAACSVGFSIDEPQKFSCTDDDDCESGYVCSKQNVCEVEAIKIDECPDADGDGYGVGEERVNCNLCKTQSLCDEDPDDTNELIYPGAPEQCDGLDNDNDGTTDNIGISCAAGANDCAPVDQTLNPGVVILCNPTSKVCEATMRTTICFGGNPDPCPCNSNVLTCTDGAFPAVPEFCQ